MIFSSSLPSSLEIEAFFFFMKIIMMKAEIILRVCFSGFLLSSMVVCPHVPPPLPLPPPSHMSGKGKVGEGQGRVRQGSGEAVKADRW